MKVLYGKVNGDNVTRNVADDQVAAHVRRGWSEEPPKAEKPKAKTKKKAK